MLGGQKADLDVGPFSPDGKRLLYVASERRGRDVYVYDLAADKATLADRHARVRGRPHLDSRERTHRILGARGKCRSVFAMNGDGTGTRQQLAEKGSSRRSLPGFGVCLHERLPGTAGISRVVVGRPEVTAAGSTRLAGIDLPEISPDGRYVTYRSWAGGSPQRYVTRYPSMDGRWLIAASRSHAHWAKDGREIYYTDGPPMRMMSVPVELDPVFSTGTPRSLFPLEPIGVEPEVFGVSPTASTSRWSASWGLRREGRDHRRRELVRGVQEEVDMRHAACSWFMAALFAGSVAAAGIDEPLRATLLQMGRTIKRRSRSPWRDPSRR